MNISAGEAESFRVRLVDVESESRDNQESLRVHEQKCAGRYQMILLLCAVQIALTAPQAWPHILTFIGWVK
jgi:hypothetical protein